MLKYSSFIIINNNFLFILLLSFSFPLWGQSNGNITEGQIFVGTARIDITPTNPIRLAGYAAREGKETDQVIHNLEAKALAFGTESQKPSLLLTVDLIGITENITSSLARSLSEEVGIDASRIAICASHTHGGPEIGNLLNILHATKDGFKSSLLPLGQLLRIATYTEDLKKKLLEVSLKALHNREPAFVSWGQGKVGFAKNRRTSGGPVDHAMPLLVVRHPKGTLRAILVNYACHATTIGSVNQIYGDWVSEAKITIENRHPETMAMVAIGCGGDSNPSPRGKMEQMREYGKEIADEVDKLLKTRLQPITEPPKAKMKRVDLPFAHVPDVSELIEQSEEDNIKGYYSRLALDRVLRGDSILAKLSYPVQVWTFGKQMIMVNLGGEVVVDYSLRLKKELGAENLWVNAYTNEVPSYIASNRVITEGGYQAEESMYWYNKPSPYKPEIENIIIEAVKDLLPNSLQK